MSFLKVPGARLFYDSRGHGPLLIMIPGAGGTAEVFRRVAEHLTARYTVVLYDRRGFSRSTLDGRQDYRRRLATDADDVRRLIEHLGDEPAVVFGASSGAIVALQVLTNHPSVVGTVVAFEPPVVRQLPGGQQWLDFFTEVYGLYCASGVQPAVARFRERTFPVSDVQVMARAPRSDANATYWLEHELRQYPAVELDLHTLGRGADRVLLAAGRDGPGYPAYDATVELSQTLGLTVIELPGGHVGFVAHPAGFAHALVHALERGSSSATRTSQSLGVMSPSDWDAAHAGRPNWEVGRPQSAFRALADDGVVRGRVLDVGCGTGEHVLMCAQLGLDATGVDVAPGALDAATAKAVERGLTARFLRRDARTLAELGERFDTVLDCGLFHTFSDDDRAAYLHSVRSVLAAGGRYFMLCFSDRQPAGHGPRRLTREEITAAFTDGWRIDAIDPTTLDSAHDPGGISGWLVALTRTEDTC